MPIHHSLPFYCLLTAMTAKYLKVIVNVSGRKTTLVSSVGQSYLLIVLLQGALAVVLKKGHMLLFRLPARFLQSGY